MGRWRQQPQHFYDMRRQLALSRNLLGESVELFDVGQIAVEQQVSDFLETGPLRHFMNVVAAIHQPGIRIDPADRGLACDHASQAWAVGWCLFSAHLVLFSLAAIRTWTNYRSPIAGQFSALGS